MLSNLDSLRVFKLKVSQESLIVSSDCISALRIEPWLNGGGMIALVVFLALCHIVDLSTRANQG